MMNLHEKSGRCPMCQAGTLKLVRENVGIEFRGKTYSAVGECLRCDACGEEFFAPGLADPLESVYAQYRAEFKVPGRIEIARLRAWLGVEALAHILKVPPSDVWLYELGAVPPEESLDDLRFFAALRAPTPAHPSLMAASAKGALRPVAPPRELSTPDDQLAA